MSRPLILNLERPATECSIKLAEAGASEGEEYRIPQWTPVSDQGGYPFCTTNALCDGLEYLAGVKGHRVLQQSRMYVHYWCRHKFGKEREQTGTAISTAIEMVQQHGVCTENSWPYDEDRWSVKPSLRAMMEADAYKGLVVARMDSASAVEEAVRRDRTVVGGVPVTTQFLSYRGSGDPWTAGKIEGNHAMLIVGVRWRAGQRQFCLRNSWGTGWGEGGYAWFPEKWLLEWFDCWAIEDAPRLGGA